LLFENYTATIKIGILNKLLHIFLPDEGKRKKKGEKRSPQSQKGRIKMHLSILILLNDIQKKGFLLK